MNLNEPRTGNLMLCECGHLKTFHFAHPKWYGGPLTDGDHCAHCQGAPNTPSACQEFKAGAFQGYKFEHGRH